MTDVPAILDVVVTRKPGDPVDYRYKINNPLCRLIEVPYVSDGIIKARQNLAIHGASPYVTWFDPDDVLYDGAVDRLITILTQHLGVTGVMMTSDISHPQNSQTTIQIKRFETAPVNSHFFRAIRRDWLTDHLDDFNWPVSEWVLTAKLFHTNAIIIEEPAFKWMATMSGDHSRITQNDVDVTREEVVRIMGYKYDYTTRLKRPHGY